MKRKVQITAAKSVTFWVTGISRHFAGRQRGDLYGRPLLDELGLGSLTIAVIANWLPKWQRCLHRS